MKKYYEVEQGINTKNDNCNFAVVYKTEDKEEAINYARDIARDLDKVSSPKKDKLEATLDTCVSLVTETGNEDNIEYVCGYSYTIKELLNTEKQYTIHSKKDMGYGYSEYNDYRDSFTTECYTIEELKKLCEKWQKEDNDGTIYWVDLVD